MKKYIDLSDNSLNREKAYKYVRSSSVYGTINLSNISDNQKKEIISNLTEMLSFYTTLNDKLISIYPLEQINESKNKESLRIYSMNQASNIVLLNFFDEVFNNKTNSYNNQGRYNHSLASIIENEYITSDESQHRLMCSDLLNHLNDIYFSEKGLFHSLPLFFNDLYLTTENQIKKRIQNKYMKKLTETKINFNNNSINKNNLRSIKENNNFGNNFSSYLIRKEKPYENFNDIGGLEKQKLLIDRYIQAIKNPEIYIKNNARLSTSILFKGPPGTGKSLIAKAMANELDCEFAKIRISDITSKYFGESEKIIQSLFDEAKKSKRIILFFDEVDSITRSRNSSDSEASHRILTTLLNNLEEISNHNNIISVFATNKYDSIDSAFKRAGRISYIIDIPLPEQKTREKIYNVKIESSKKNSLKNKGDGIFMNFSNKDYETFAKLSDGFNGADINEVIERAKVEKSYNEIKFNEKELINSSKLINIIKNYERNKLIV